MAYTALLSCLLQYLGIQKTWQEVPEICFDQFRRRVVIFFNPYILMETVFTFLSRYYLLTFVGVEMSSVYKIASESTVTSQTSFSTLWLDLNDTVLVLTL